MSTTRCQHEWEKNARLDPLFAILSCADAQDGKWKLPEFFATGAMEIDRVFAELAALDALPRRHGRFLDFGCGVGRLSQALAGRFETGVGVDVSARMVELAREHAGAMPSVTFLHNTAPDLACIPDGSVNFVYSHIVLQHVSPELQRSYILDFGRVLEPGGVSAFQIPVELVGPVTAPARPHLVQRIVPQAAKDHVKRLLGMTTHNDIVTMEMNCLADTTVRCLLAQSGCTLLDMRYSNSAERDHNGRLEFFGRDEAVARIARGEAISPMLSGFYFARKQEAPRQPNAEPAAPARTLS